MEATTTRSLIRQFNALDWKGASRTEAERDEFRRIWDELTARGIMQYTEELGYHIAGSYEG